MRSLTAMQIKVLHSNKKKTNQQASKQKKETTPRLYNWWNNNHRILISEILPTGMITYTTAQIRIG